MRVNTINLSGVTADADGIAVSQTPAAGGEQSLTLTGTNPPVPMIIDITSAGDDSGRTFTVSGTDRFGESISEDVAGANAGVAQTTKQFATIDSVTVDDDTAGAVTVGWAAVVYSGWFPLNTYADSIETMIAITVSDTVDFDLEYTFENLQRNRGKYGDLEADVDVFTDSDIDGDTASIAKVITFRATGIRLKINSGTGSLTARVTQAGNR